MLDGAAFDTSNVRRAARKPTNGRTAHAIAQCRSQRHRAAAECPAKGVFPVLQRDLATVTHKANPISAAILNRRQRLGMSAALTSKGEVSLR